MMVKQSTDHELTKPDPWIVEFFKSLKGLRGLNINFSCDKKRDSIFIHGCIELDEEAVDLESFFNKEKLTIHLEGPEPQVEKLMNRLHEATALELEKSKHARMP